MVFRPGKGVGEEFLVKQLVLIDIAPQLGIKWDIKIRIKFNSFVVGRGR